MIELMNNHLIAHAPEVHPAARCAVHFQRTLRIPDDNREYPLPAGLGDFPVFHVDDYADTVPTSWAEHGGVFLPMYQSEAMWMSFVRRFDYPFAIKIAAGKINAVTGEPWKDGLSDAPQDYVVVPGQPWLDGFAISEGLIRQFVAMPLGEGYTAEGQITGKEEFGGLQIAMYPMTPERFAQYIADKVSVESAIVHDGGFDDMYFASMDSADALIGGSAGEVRFRSCEIGLAPGGLMRQEIYEDPYGVDAWDQSAISRCFVHIVNSNAFHDITGRRPPTKPPTASQYKAAGIPWFDYWDKEAKSLKGSKILAMLDSVATKKVREGKPVAEPQIDVGKPVQIGSRKPQVRDGKF